MDQVSLDQQSYTALAALNHLLSKVQDEETALESIEMVADAIDVVVDLVDKNRMSDETGKAAAVDYLLKMLRSPCEEVVKLSLAGLDHLMSRREVAVYSGRIGAFDVLANLIMTAAAANREYEKIKASDVLAFLLAPQDNRFLKASVLKHPIFDEHIRMVLSGHEKYVERGLQFLWCITDNFKEAQERVLNRVELFPAILKAIADADSGRNALRLLNNLSKHESAKKKLPVGDITRLVKPIMRIPDKVISKKDKGITALTVSNLLESGTAVDKVLVEYLRDLVGELLDGSFHSSKLGLAEIIMCFNGLASKDENKVVLAECGIIKTLLPLLKLEPTKHFSDVKVIQSVKETAAKTLWYMAYNEQVRKQMRAEAVLEYLQAVSNSSSDEKIKKNIKDILWVFELKDANEKMSNLKTAQTLKNTTSPVPSPSSPSLTGAAVYNSPPAAPQSKFMANTTTPATSVPPSFSKSATSSPAPTSTVVSAPKYTATSASPVITHAAPAPAPAPKASPTVSYSAPSPKATFSIAGTRAPMPTVVPAPTAPAPTPIAKASSVTAPTAAVSSPGAPATTAKPKWMGSASTAKPSAPSPTAPSPVVSKPPTTPTNIASMENKPKWFVSKKT